MAVSSKNLWVDMKELLLEQYRGDLREKIEAQGCSLPEGADNRLQGLLKSITDELVQPLDDAAVAIQDVANVETAEGAWLDLIGKIAGVGRKIDETDENYRLRVRNALGFKNAGTPDGTIYSTAILSGDPRPQYIDEADCTFFVYTGHRPIIGTDEWEQGGRQLSRSQVKKLAPAGVLGLPAAAIRLDGGKLLGTYADNDNERKLIVVPASDRTISREVLLADNNGAIVVTPQSVPVRVVLRGPSVPSIPTITTEWSGVPVDAVRIKDLPAAGDTNGYFVRDSDTEGTTSTRAMDEQTLDDLWNSTPAEDD